MGCGCSKARSFTSTNPLTIGEANGDDPVRVRSTVGLMGMSAGQDFWVTGDGVSAMIGGGWLALL